jgi:hypothetical protein
MVHVHMRGSGDGQKPEDIFQEQYVHFEHHARLYPEMRAWLETTFWLFRMISSSDRESEEIIVHLFTSCLSVHMRPRLIKCTKLVQAYSIEEGKTEGLEEYGRDRNNQCQKVQ